MYNKSIILQFLTLKCKVKYEWIQKLVLFTWSIHTDINDVISTKVQNVILNHVYCQ
jgi:hypothetical protein